MEIIIRPPDTSNPYNADAGFIVKTLNEKKHISADSNKINDDKIREIFKSSTTRIMTVDGYYTAFGYLTGLQKGLYADFHGYINGVKGYKFFKKHYLFDYVLDTYFNDFDIKSINVFYPHFLEHDHKGRRRAGARLLGDSGFKRIETPIRNFDSIDGKPIDVFVYQAHKPWFIKWQKIKNDYESGILTIKTIAEKYKVNEVKLLNIADKKQWKRRF